MEITPHMQGYYYNAISITTLKALLPAGVHIEAAKGSPQHNINYCSKEGKFYEFGIAPMQGQRLDIVASLDMNNKDIRETWPLFADKLIHNCKKVTEYQHYGYNHKKEIIYITGPSGSGKTRLAYELAGLNADLINIHNDFVIGYSNETKNIIWDEFRDSDCKLNLFLKLTDKMSNRISTKGGDALFYTDLLVITSIKTLNSLYPFSGESQIRQRITQVIDLAPQTYAGKVNQ
jgi:hypothetical protein